MKTLSALLALALVAASFFLSMCPQCDDKRVIPAPSSWTAEDMAGAILSSYPDLTSTSQPGRIYVSDRVLTHRELCWCFLHEDHIRHWDGIILIMSREPEVETDIVMKGMPSNHLVVGSLVLVGDSSMLDRARECVK